MFLPRIVRFATLARFHVEITMHQQCDESVNANRMRGLVVIFPSAQFDQLPPADAGWTRILGSTSNVVYDLGGAAVDQVLRASSFITSHTAVRI